MSSRRQARIAALQTLYEVDATQHDVEEVLRRNLSEPALEGADNPQPLEPAAWSYASKLVHGVLEHKHRLDEIIASSAPNWPVEQMSRVDKTILRLAIFEILFDNEVPVKAAINEAVELAKRFGSDSSSRFINGVLGTVAAGPQAKNRRGKAMPETKPGRPLPDRQPPETEAVKPTVNGHNQVEES